MNKKEILIIEDENDIADLLKEFLEENDFSVSIANDGRKAVDMMKKRMFDLLIVDMLLPGEHGLDIIKMKINHLMTPIIIISGVYDEEEIQSLVRGSNIRFFIRKPFDLKDVLIKVKKAIDADPL
jgi:DNA-binding response OmpR family regulator